MLRSLRFPGRLAARAEPQIEVWNPTDVLSRLEGERSLLSENYPDAERHLTEALREAEKNRYSLATRVRLALLLSQAQCAQNKLVAGEESARTAIEMAAQLRDQSMYAQCLDQLANVFTAQENFAAVEAVAVEALRIERALLHPEPKRLAERTHRLGLAQYRIGRSEEAIPALEQAVELHDQAFGAEHEETAKLVTELGGLYRVQERHAEAQKHLKRALLIREKLHGVESAEVMTVLHQLAGSLEECGDTDGAAAMYERSLHLRERVVGGDQEVIAEEQFKLAGLYVDWGKHSRARELLKESIGWFKRTRDRRLALAFQALAHVEEHSGRFLAAVEELGHAGKLWETMGPDRVADLIANLEHRVELLEMLRKKSEAGWLREKAEALKALYPDSSNAANA